jgi:hypothetical protein
LKELGVNEFFDQCPKLDDGIGLPFKKSIEDLSYNTELKHRGPAVPTSEKEEHDNRRMKKYDHHALAEHLISFCSDTKFTVIDIYDFLEVDKDKRNSANFYYTKKKLAEVLASRGYELSGSFKKDFSIRCKEPSAIKKLVEANEIKRIKKETPVEVEKPSKLNMLQELMLHMTKYPDSIDEFNDFLEVWGFNYKIAITSVELQEFQRGD